MRTLLIVLISMFSFGLFAIESTARSHASDDDQEIHIQFEFHGEGFGNGNASCVINPFGNCQGIAWSGKGSGFSLGTILNNAETEDADFELIFSFSCSSEDGEPYLDGELYSLDLNPDGSGVAGQRRKIHEPIDFGHSHRLKFKSQKSGKSIEMEYRVEGGSMETEVTFGENTLALTSFDRGLLVSSLTGEAQELVSLEQDRDRLNGLSVEPQHFSFEFMPEAARGHRRDTAVRYDVTISFDPPLQKDHYPMHSKMKLDRMYWIDTLHVPGDSILPNWGTGFSYTKDVEIVPGKVLKLVFPPEPRQILPFQIEDTVEIHP